MPPLGIYGSWGGLPYKDLELCLEHLHGLPSLDLDNAVAAGGSYGGYMMLWAQGHALGRKVSYKAHERHLSPEQTFNHVYLLTSLAL